MATPHLPNLEPFEGGKKDKGEYAKQWIRRFISTAAMAGWDDTQLCAGFPAYIKGRAYDWYFDDEQLSEADRKISKPSKPSLKVNLGQYIIRNSCA
jgi:hypothetical protein